MNTERKRTPIVPSLDKLSEDFYVFEAIMNIHVAEMRAAIKELKEKNSAEA